MEDDWCTFLVRGFDGRGRPCSNTAATRGFGDIAACHIHLRKLESAAMRMLARWPTQVEILHQLDWEHPEVRSVALDGLKAFDPDGYLRLIRQRTRRQTKATEENSVIYYVRRAGHIKIGYTTHLSKRLVALSRGGDKRPECVGIGPVELLHHHQGGPTAEGQLHQRFRHCHVTGEWFRAVPDLLAHIDKLKARPTARSAA